MLVPLRSAPHTSTSRLLERMKLLRRQRDNALQLLLPRRKPRQLLRPLNRNVLLRRQRRPNALD